MNTKRALGRRVFKISAGAGCKTEGKCQGSYAWVCGRKVRKRSSE